MGEESDAAVTGGATGRRGGLLLIGGLMLAAMALDYVLPWPYVMAPLYIVPVLVAAQRERPAVVAATAAVATVVDVLSAFVQGLPLEINVFYNLGLVAAGYLAFLLAAERGRTAARAQAATLRARSSERSQGDLQRFIGMVSHDQRQPLTSLLMAVQLLQRRAAPALDETDRRLIVAIEVAAQRARRLSDDLLDAARIGTGQFSIHPTPFDLAPLVHQVAALQDAAAAGGARVAVDAPPRLEVVWDRDRVGQLLANLVSNAVKYSPPGGEVVVGVHQRAQEAILVVTDHGPGIPAAELPRLFRPFSRIEGGGAKEGTGLGLYICRAVAEAHGGRIRVQSAPGGGSSFVVELPLAACTGPRTASAAEGATAPV